MAKLTYTLEEVMYLVEQATLAGPLMQKIVREEPKEFIEMTIPEKRPLMKKPEKMVVLMVDSDKESTARKIKEAMTVIGVAGHGITTVSTSVADKLIAEQHDKVITLTNPYADLEPFYIPDELQKKSGKHMGKRHKHKNNKFHP